MWEVAGRPRYHEGVRARLEARERLLSPLAAKSYFSRGRLRPEEPSPTRTEFQRDRDRIIHSKAFRRLKHKTQVFFAPQGDHYVTRLTHTLELAQIARSIARALNLNEDLTEAIALAHDLGHPPFGHAGEEALNEVVPGGFRHYEQSLRVVDVLEKNGQGLNLTWETRVSILKHSKARESLAAPGAGVAPTLEGQIVKLADAIAYLNHDIGDAVRAGFLREEDLPALCRRVLGTRHAERINTMVCDIIDASWEAVRAAEDSREQTRADYEALQADLAARAERGEALIRMSPAVQEATDCLREFMFQTVYLDSQAKAEEAKAKRLVQMLYTYYCQHPEALPPEYRAYLRRDPVERVVCDYIAGMTDRYALAVFQEIYCPKVWAV